MWELTKSFRFEAAHERIQHTGRLTRVSVHRDSSSESCTCFGPQGQV